MNTIMKMLVALLTVTGLFSLQAEQARSVANEGARVYIISPADGDIVDSDLIVRFGLSGMGVAPAGTNMPGTGHHHLLLDLAEAPDMSKPLPASEKVIHFGKGQTQVKLSLTPGSHTLQLLLGDYVHTPHDNPLFSKKITVTVR